MYKTIYKYILLTTIFSIMLLPNNAKASGWPVFDLSHAVTEIVQTVGGFIKTAEIPQKISSYKERVESLGVVQAVKDKIDNFKALEDKLREKAKIGSLGDITGEKEQENIEKLENIITRFNTTIGQLQSDYGEKIQTINDAQKRVNENYAEDLANISSLMATATPEQQKILQAKKEMLLESQAADNARVEKRKGMALDIMNEKINKYKGQLADLQQKLAQGMKDKLSKGLYDKFGIGDEVKKQKDYLDETEEELFIKPDDKLTVTMAEEQKFKRKETLKLALNHGFASALANSIRLNEKDPATGIKKVEKNLNDLTKEALEAEDFRAALASDTVILARMAEEFVETARLSIYDLRLATTREINGIKEERMERQEDLDFTDYNFYDEYFVDYEAIRQSMEDGGN